MFYSFYEQDEMVAEVLQKLIEIHGEQPFHDPSNSVWSIFVEEVIVRINSDPQYRYAKGTEMPSSPDGIFLFGQDVFAERFLKIPYKIMRWHIDALRKDYKPEELFWLMLEKVAREALDKLKESIKNYYIAEERLKNGLNARNSKEVLPGLYRSALEILGIQAEEKMPSESEIEDCQTKLLAAIEQVAEQWAKKHNLVDDNGNVVEWCLEEAKKVCPHPFTFMGAGPLSTEMYSRLILPKNKWDFNFNHPGWDPNKLYINPKKLKEQIKKEMEIYLDKYFADKEEQYGLKIEEVDRREEDALHVEWLIRYLVPDSSGKPWSSDRIAKYYNRIAKCSNRTSRQDVDYWITITRKKLGFAARPRLRTRIR